jgi:nitrogen fixation-related uncharacterized protein
MPVFAHMDLGAIQVPGGKKWALIKSHAVAYRSSWITLVGLLCLDFHIPSARTSGVDNTLRLYLLNAIAIIFCFGRFRPLFLWAGFTGRRIDLQGKHARILRKKEDLADRLCLSIIVVSNEQTPDWCSSLRLAG